MTQQRDAIELIEVLPGKLYYIASRCDATSTASSPSTALDAARVHFIDVTREFHYAGFYRDFGPLSLGHAVAFTHRLDALLAQLDRDARVCVHASTSTSTTTTYNAYAPTFAQHSANAVCLLGCWAVLRLGWTAARAFAPFAHLPLPPFHDASRGSDPFGLTVAHVLQGLARAIETQLFTLERFSVDAFFRDASVAAGDISWLSPTVVACASPCDASNDSMLQLPPAHYAAYFCKHNVAVVVRLSRRRYDATPFTAAGVEVVDLSFPDGATPCDDVLQSFLTLYERTMTGAIAVHCTAGLGRTGTLVACALMQQHRFTAEEAIGWLRLCRPGSVVGCQQFYLRAKQQELWGAHTRNDNNNNNNNNNVTEEHCAVVVPVTHGIAARPRRRSSEGRSSTTAMLRKCVEQLCGGSNTHSKSCSMAKRVQTASSPVVSTGMRRNALLPPRIPTQGEQLIARKRMQQQQQQTNEPMHPALVASSAAQRLGLWM